eukprot:7457074-Ditylum_brightwellii.AAC.1
MGIEKFKMTHHTSALIRKVLKIDGLIPKELTKLKSIIDLALGDGYAALYNLHWFTKHSNFIKDKVERSIP